jgi:serine/threonine protein kinase
VPVINGQFGPYRLDQIIGRGGMGEVYRAYDTVHERVVAIKLLLESLSADPDYRARFEREARIAAGLREQHIIPIHRFGEIDGRLFIDMRLVDGEDLGKVLAREGALDPRRAVGILAQLAAALDAAHQANLIHRDIKPANVLLADHARGTADAVYLVDFGIARDSTAATSLTVTGAAVGTPDYMAPERFTAGRIDRRADIYALGCLFYEMLTGSKPFAGGEYPALLYKHLNAEPPKPSAARTGVPAALDAVVARSMAKNPESRFASAGELAAAAEDALDGSAARPSLVKDELTTPITRSRPSTPAFGPQIGPQIGPQSRAGHTPPPAGHTPPPGRASYTPAPGHAAYSPAGQTPSSYPGHTPPPERAGYPTGHSPAHATAAYTPPPGHGGYPPPAGVGYGAPSYSPPPSQGTNGFAIAALIFGIIGGALLGFIFGFIALSQTKRTGQNGRGMAIAGIVLSALWTIGVLLLIILAVASSTPSGPVTPTTFPTASPTAEPTTEPPVTTAPSTAISATELQVGDCLNDLTNSTDVSSLPSVDCAQPHQGEVFAVFDLPPGPYPGADGVDDLVSKGCNARLAEYSPGAPSDDAVGLFSVYPLEQNWERGDREVVCIAKATSGTTTGSIKGR